MHLSGTMLQKLYVTNYLFILTQKTNILEELNYC